MSASPLINASLNSEYPAGPMTFDPEDGKPRGRPRANSIQSTHSHHGASFLPAGGVLASVYTLCAMSLGVGVFVLPSVMKKMGLVAGMVAIGVFALWANWTQLVIIDVAQSFKPPIYSLDELAERTLGKPGRFLLSFFTAITTFLANAAHMKTVTGILQDTIEWFVTGGYGNTDFPTSKTLVLYVLLLMIALVKSSDGKINQLRHISTTSVFAVLVTCMWCTGECMFWYWPQGHHAFSGENAVPYVSSNWREYATDLPAVAFAFSGTFVLFPVFHEIRDKSRANMGKVIAYSNGVCAFGYGTVALIGALTFGNAVDQDGFNHTNTASNYLYVFPPDHYGVTLLRFFLVLTITLLFAVINFPMLTAVESLGSLLPGAHPLGCLRAQQSRLLVTIVAMVGMVVIDIAITDLTVLFGLCGGWGMTFVCYFIPSLIGIAAGHKHTPALYVSCALVLVLAFGFTYVLFTPTPSSSSHNHTDTDGLSYFGPGL